MPRLTRCLIRAAALLALVGAASAQAALDRTERTIANHTTKGQAAAEALLEKTVNIASPTEDLAGVRAAGDVVAAELQAIGFETRWFDVPDGMKRAGHLVAETKGTNHRGPRLPGLPDPGRRP
jgi:glutamate carboxypeptidase